jgi:hypothetical protein
MIVNACVPNVWHRFVYALLRIYETATTIDVVGWRSGFPLCILFHSFRFLLVHFPSPLFRLLNPRLYLDFASFKPIFRLNPLETIKSYAFWHM